MDWPTDSYVIFVLDHTVQKIHVEAARNPLIGPCSATRFERAPEPNLSTLSPPRPFAHCWSIMSRPSRCRQETMAANPIRWRPHGRPSFPVSPPSLISPHMPEKLWLLGFRFPESQRCPMTKHDESKLVPTLDHAGRPKPWLCETKKQHVFIIDAFECILDARCSRISPCSSMQSFMATQQP